jgi:hypothetical protein
MQMYGIVTLELGFMSWNCNLKWFGKIVGLIFYGPVGLQLW